MDPLGNHIKAFKCGGIWTWPNQPRWYHTYAIVLCTLAYVIYPSLMIVNILVSENIYELIEAMFFLPTALIGIKLYILYRNKPKVIELCALIRRMESVAGANEAEQRLLRVVSQQPTSRCFFSLWVVYILTSVWSYIEAQMDGTKRRLMWPMWLPFDLQTCPAAFHQIALNYQAMVTVNDCLMHSALDTFAVAMFNAVGAYLDVLGVRLERIGGGAKNRRKSEVQLRNCIRLHYQCLEFNKFTTEIMSTIFIIQFGMSGATLCGSEFQLSTVSTYIYFRGHFQTFIWATRTANCYGQFSDI